MQCDDLYQLGGSAGIINFGGDIRNTGNVLRVNGHMQSALNSAVEGVGNVLIVGSPIQIDAIAWNTTVNSTVELQVLVGIQNRARFFFERRGVIQLQDPVQLPAGSMVSLRVGNIWGPPPGASQLSLYASSR